MSILESDPAPGPSPGPEGRPD
ncbi:MAG: hypothetical protein QOE80_3534, partial [Actinomycetota bacterium]|nr:hypothetical protein [Actinomycetota bacterium]